MKSMSFCCHFKESNIEVGTMSDEKALDRALSVVQTLHKRTNEGKVNWQQSSAYAGGFQADFGGLAVVIREIPDPEYPDEPNYTLSIIQKTTGQIIESISNITLRPVMNRTTEEGLNPYVALERTFKMARRKALKVDDALEDLLQELGGPGD
jgi:hypothetical protein